ncbi:hypothetical protein D3C76_1449950 [compost metagenome]
MGQVVDIHQLTEHLAVAPDATQARARDVHAVIAACSADHFGLGRLTLEAPVRPGHFDRSVRALGTRVGIEHMVQVAGHQVSDALGQHER